VSISGLVALAQPVRIRVVAKYLGLLGLSLAAMLVVPAIAAVALGDIWFTVRCLWVAVLLVAIGIPTARLAVPEGMRRNEALTIIALTFLAGTLAMSWPFMATGLPLADALFEAASGITTTGLTTLKGLEKQSPALIFGRAWLQWYGGLAIIVLALALIIGPGQVALRLEGDKAPGEDLVASTRIRSRQVLGIYGILTLTGIALLWLGGMSSFDAVVHGLAAVSTGGFSSRDAGFGDAGWDGILIPMAICLLSLAGAVSFALQFRAWRTGPRALFGDSEFRALIVAIFLVVLMLWLTLSVAGEAFVGKSWDERLGTAAFLAVSAQTTTGFADVEVASLDPASKLVLIAAMIVGGDAGSTAGGLKIVRVLIMLRLVQLAMAQACLPRQAVVQPRIGGRTLEPGEPAGVLAFLALYLATIAVSWLIFLLHGQAPLDSLFEVVSALGTVGLSCGVTSTDLPTVLKLVLGIDMFLGRLEIIALLLLLYHRNWRGSSGTT